MQKLDLNFVVAAEAVVAVAAVVPVVEVVEAFDSFAFDLKYKNRNSILFLLC